MRPPPRAARARRIAGIRSAREDARRRRTDAGRRARPKREDPATSTERRYSCISTLSDRLRALSAEDRGRRVCAAIDACGSSTGSTGSTSSSPRIRHCEDSTILIGISASTSPGLPSVSHPARLRTVPWRWKRHQWRRVGFGMLCSVRPKFRMRGVVVASSRNTREVVLELIDLARSSLLHFSLLAPAFANWLMLPAGVV